MTTRPVHCTLAIVIAASCLAVAACDAESLLYQLNVEPESISVEIGAEDEQPVIVTSSHLTLDAVDEVLTVLSSDPEIVTLGSFTPTRGFNDISQLDERFYYIPLELNEASMTVTCLAPGSALIRLEGELNGSTSQYDAVAEFEVTCSGERSDLVVTIDSVTDASLAFLDMDGTLVFGEATINFTVTNLGEATAGPFSVAAWGDLDTAPVGGTDSNTVEFAGLAAGATVSGSIHDAMVEALDAADAWAYVDSTQDQAETDEENNASAPYSWP